MILEVAAGRKQYDEKFPFSIELHLTDKCNLKCEWCTYKELRKNGAMLSLNIIQKLFKELGKSNTGITIEGGGEPTLHPNFGDIIKSAKENNIDIGLIPNGTVDISE